MDILFTLAKKGVAQPCALFPYAHSFLASETGGGAVLVLLNKAAEREKMPQICDRFLRVLVRTKNLYLSLPLQGNLRQQIEEELLRVTLFPGFDEEENTIFVHSLVEVMANEAVLMIADVGESKKGVFVSAASAWLGAEGRRDAQDAKTGWGMQSVRSVVGIHEKGGHVSERNAIRQQSLVGYRTQRRYHHHTKPVSGECRHLQETRTTKSQYEDEQFEGNTEIFLLSATQKTEGL
jgi:hypothetical protein